MKDNVWQSAALGFRCALVILELETRSTSAEPEIDRMPTRVSDALGLAHLDTGHETNSGRICEALNFQ